MSTALLVAGGVIVGGGLVYGAIILAIMSNAGQGY